MTNEKIKYFCKKEELYEEVVLQLKGLFEDCPYGISNLSNAAAVLNQAMEDINWVGFYIRKDDRLILGPFQGKPACVEIKIGKGVCGTAVEKDEVQLVKNVHEFPGHIACDGASNSEIVLPIHVKRKIWGVLDIDSPLLCRFDKEDQAGLEKVIGILEKMLEKSRDCNRYE